MNTRYDLRIIAGVLVSVLKGRILGVPDYLHVVLAP